MTRTRTGLFTALLAALLATACAGMPRTGAGGAAAQRFEQVRASPPELRAFLARMPKGADLHSHLSGAVYAESYIRMAAEQSLCLDTAAMAFRPPAPKATCAAGTVPAGALLTDQGLYTKTVNALSLRDFVPVSGWSGHDQFFVTFGRFGAATGAAGDLLAEAVDRAGRQRVEHVELMATAGNAGAVRDLADKAGWNGDAADTTRRLMEAGLGDLIPGAKADLDRVEARMRGVLRCGTADPSDGCGVSVRYLQQVGRNQSPARVFAQTLFAFLLAQAEPRVVGLNFVGPEDYRIARADYTLHMRMIDALHRVMPGVNVALHAGELTLGIVPPEDLRFHIRQAVELGHAKRIGHGVDVMYEDDPWGLLRLMAERRVAVEIALSSNDQILGVRDQRHPFPVYRKAGVPTVVSTDDEGVSRSDLTNELQRAATTYGLSYADLVTLARNGLEYSFLPGA
ncbi:MAG TPA: adenosine deaminase, partial [Azospirillum sp.]